MTILEKVVDYLALADSAKDIGLSVKKLMDADNTLDVGVAASELAASLAVGAAAGTLGKCYPIHERCLVLHPTKRDGEPQPRAGTDIAALPEWAGMGNLRRLRQAMAGGETRDPLINDRSLAAGCTCHLTRRTTGGFRHFVRYSRKTT